jgi:metal-responsive CopG/Arc/MetJ family transcriptional regulator
VTKPKSNTVKIDETLLGRVEKLIKMKDKKIKYANRKQFINVAVLQLLEKEEVVNNG